MTTHPIDTSPSEVAKLLAADRNALIAKLAETEKERDGLRANEAQFWVMWKVDLQRLNESDARYKQSEDARHVAMNELYAARLERDAALAQLAEAERENEWRPIDPNALPDPKCGPYLTTNNPGARDAFGCPSHVWLVSMFHRTDGPEGPVTAFREDGYTKLWGLKMYASIPSPPTEGEDK